MKRSAIEPGSAPLPWRKRHPVWARTLLYGLGLCLAALGFFLWQGRREQDRQDRVAYLWARLEQLPIVLQTDPLGAGALAVLDAEYQDASLPVELRARVLRLRGIVARNRKDLPAVNAAYLAAGELEGERGRTGVTELEWAQCLVDLGDVGGARAKLARLPAPAAVGGEFLIHGLLRAFVEAETSAAEGRGEEARQRVHLLLDALEEPLPTAERQVWFALRSWTAADACVELSRFLVAGLPQASPAAAAVWKRLGRLGSQHLDALLVATLGLLEAGDAPAARSTWSAARTLDAGAAARAAERIPTLRTLGGT